MTPKEQEAFALFKATIRQPSQILEVWERKDLFPELGQCGVAVQLGLRGSQETTDLAQRYEARTKKPFPPLLLALLTEANGVDVDGIDERQVDVVREDAIVGVLNGLCAASDVDIDTAGPDDQYAGLAFATPYGQEAIILDEQTGVLVLDDGEGRVEVVAESLTEFIHGWCEFGLSVSSYTESRSTDA